MVSPEVGQTAVRIARETLVQGLGGKPPSDPAERFRLRALDPVFDELRGIFVTLRRFPGKALRGCIGFPEPVYPLRTGLPRAAWSAAVEDPRFPPLVARELPKTVVEVSILTPPEHLPESAPAHRVRSVRVGIDGLVVRGFGTSGLLLPQVATEEGWSAQEFLRATCMKAGLPEDAWTDPAVEVFRFQAEVFSEVEPAGAVEHLPTI